MKQAQSGTSSLVRAGRRWPIGSGSPRPLGPARCRPSAGVGGPVAGAAWWPGRAVLALLAAVWFIVTLPFRLVFRLMALLGRLAGIALGFVLMVAGMFFLASPFFLIGIPLFIIGLVLTLRCLE